MATTEELLKKNTQTTTDNTAVSTPEASNNVTTGAYNTARLDAINKMYDAQQSQREQELKSAYDQSVSAQQAAQQKIAPQYQQSANDLATQYERNRLNFARQAAASGVNTGTAAQESLARAGQYQRDFGALRTAEADAQAEAARKLADLETQYKNAVASALAQNDYNRAGALLDEYNNGYQRDLQQAQILAEYGDFTGFANLYGKEQANAMFMLWAAQNPDFAYNSGKITRDQYKVMTGKDPVGWTATGGISINDLVDGKLPEGAGGGAFGSGSAWDGWAANQEGNWFTKYSLGGWDPNNTYANTQLVNAAVRENWGG